MCARPVYHSKESQSGTIKCTLFQFFPQNTESLVFYYSTLITYIHIYIETDSFTKENAIKNKGTKRSFLNSLSVFYLSHMPSYHKYITYIYIDI